MTRTSKSNDSDDPSRIPAAGPAGWFDDLLAAAGELDLEYHQPWPPASKVFNANGESLRYLDWGNDHLPPLVFIHGFAQQAHSWDFAALSVRDLHHVLSIDLRGHGESDRSPTGSYSFDLLYEDLEAFVSRIDARTVTLCGLSLGGMLACFYAARNPARVDALVLAEWVPESRNAGTEAIRRFTAGQTSFGTLDELVQKVRGLTPWRSEAQVRSSLVHSCRQTSSGEWEWKYDPGINTLFGSTPGVEERWEMVSRVTAPTLLVRGEDSDITDVATVERMAKLLQRGRVASVASAWHRVAGDNPREFNSRLRQFLRSASE